MPGPLPHLPPDGTLLVLRGNSGSGKSTIAHAVHRHFDHGRSTLIAQDNIRRTILREPDTPGAFTIELIELIATTCLPRRQLVIVEGILDADRYGPMLETLTARARRALFYAWALTFEQTLTRHAQRPQATEFGETEMRSWYHGWQPLPFVTETRIDHTWTQNATIDRILDDLHEPEDQGRPASS
jgi:energy-coupling factor transporter ATP-binding protein EcfA2